MKKGVIAIIVIVALAVIGYLVFKPEPAPEQTAAVETPAPAPSSHFICCDSQTAFIRSISKPTQVPLASFEENGG